MSLCYGSGMRPSLIVMPVLVCVPFGLAIRETMTRVTPEETAEGIRARNVIRDEVDVLHTVQRRSEWTESLHQLYGAKPAQLGPMFDGITLGMPYGAVDESRFKKTNDVPISIVVIPEYEAVAGIEVRSNDQELCHELRARVVAAWGPSANEQWFDPATHQRATVRAYQCLSFAKYTPLAEWIGDKKPEWLALVGTKVDKLRQQETVEQADQFDDDSLLWQRPPLEGGIEPMRFTARVARGTIVGVTIDVRSDDETITAVFDRLERSLGKAKELEGVSTFPGTPLVKFQRLDRQHAEIRVGNADAPESDL